RLEAVRSQGQAAGGLASPERRRAPGLPRHEPPRVRHGPHRVTHNGHIRPVLWRGPDGPLARTLETQADRRPLPAVPQEATAGDRSGAAIRLHRGPAPEALPHEGSEPEGPHPERGVRQCLGPPDLRNEEGQDCHGKANPSNPNFVTRNIITRGATIQTEI